MKKILLIVGFVSILLLTGCCKEHDWLPATCTEPETCSICGKTQGEPLSHRWEGATCLEPAHCTVCGLTDGERSDHLWEEPTCSHPYRCMICGLMVGNSLDHTWIEANYQTPKTCSVCGETEGTAISAGFDLYEMKCRMELGIPTSFHTVTLTPNLYTDGSATITAAECVTDYNGTALPAAEGYSWYHIHAEASVYDVNALTYGYSVGCAYADYYSPDVHDTPTSTLPINETIHANQYSVNWYGTDYPECLDFSTFEKGIVTENGATLKTDYYARVPTGYDGIVVGFYNNEPCMNRTDVPLKEYAALEGVYFRYLPFAENAAASIMDQTVGEEPSDAN